MNLLGALLGTGVAQTVGSGIIETSTGPHGLLVITGAVVGAIVWNLITWFFGLPSSSSHALIGGLAGFCAGATSRVHWALVWTRSSSQWSCRRSSASEAVTTHDGDTVDLASGVTEPD